MMGEADIAGVTRSGLRWELTFHEGGSKFRLAATHLRDVIRMLEANIEVIGDEPAAETMTAAPAVPKPTTGA